MANIFSLFGTIFIDNQEADKSIDETTKKGENAGSKIGKAFGAIGKAAVAMGTATVSRRRNFKYGGLRYGYEYRRTSRLY